MEERLITRAEIARRLNVRQQTIATWTRRGWFPKPVKRISDRLILYSSDQVDNAIAARDQRRTARRPPRA